MPLALPTESIKTESIDAETNKVEAVKNEALFFGLSLNDFQCRQIVSYLSLLRKWDRKVNLTGIRSDAEAIRVHFLESIFAAEQLAPRQLRLVDVGAGAGFPGLAMKIVRPEFRTVLLDSRKKKVLFQREVIRRLDLKHVVAYPLRLQEGAVFLRQADVVCWRGLRLEGKDFEFLKSNTSAQCLYLCFQGEGQATERRLEGCVIEKVPIPRSKGRTLLLARKKAAELHQSTVARSDNKRVSWLDDFVVGDGS